MLKKLMNASRPLTVTGLLMVPVLAGALVGMMIDPRVITGSPSWLKPAKFAVSIAIYSFTLAWIFSLIPDWTRTRRIVGGMTAFVLLVEMAIIVLQVVRGTTSHFNVSTPLDGILFGVMGAAIVTQTFSSLAVAVALWRTRFADNALGWALRLGIIITIIGAFTGGLMTRPTAEQLTAARTGQTMAIVGAHTVGGPDGGPGLPGTGWSTQHGDVRVPHFVGLHALQVLPLLAVVLSRRRLPDVTRLRLMLTAGASYATFFGVLLWQALRGQSVLAPDALSLALFATWAIVTSAAAVAVTMRAKPTFRPAAV